MCFLTGPCFKLKVGFIKMFLVILIYFWCAIKKVAFFLILNVLCFSASSKILNIFLPLCAPFLSIAVIPCYRRATKINYRLQTWTGIWLHKTSVKNKVSFSVFSCRSFTIFIKTENVKGRVWFKMKTMSLIFIQTILFLWYNIFSICSHLKKLKM